MDILTHPIVLGQSAIAAIVLVAVILTGRRITLKIGAVSAELQPNGGESLRDAVNRIEHRVSKIEHELKTNLINPLDENGQV